MVLLAPQQDCIQCIAWACHHQKRLRWPPVSIVLRDLAVRMIGQIMKDHFETIRVQIEWEEEGKLTLKTIPMLTDISVYRLTVTMSKHFCDFEAFLS